MNGRSGRLVVAGLPRAAGDSPRLVGVADGIAGRNGLCSLSGEWPGVIVDLVLHLIEQLRELRVIASSEILLRGRDDRLSLIGAVQGEQDSDLIEAYLRRPQRVGRGIKLGLEAVESSEGRLSHRVELPDLLQRFVWPTEPFQGLRGPEVCARYDRPRCGIHGAEPRDHRV